jgi:NADPH:quinone reductase-like Zn-dependent oxidoreductase
LVKNAFSTVNPVDGYLMYQKKDGSTIGAEGSGTIIEVGEGVSSDLVGKKVAFSYGAWATHSLHST